MLTLVWGDAQAYARPHRSALLLLLEGGQEEQGSARAPALHPLHTVTSAVLATPVSDFAIPPRMRCSTTRWRRSWPPDSLASTTPSRWSLFPTRMPVETALTLPPRRFTRLFVARTGHSRVQCDIVLWKLVDPPRRVWRSATAASRRCRGGHRDYVALIAHDCGTREYVQGQAQAVQRRSQRKGNSDSKDVESLAAIVANTQRMGAMIEDLLESSQLESGALLLRRRPIDLSRLAAEVVAQLPSVDERQRIRVLAPSPGPRVSADAARIERVLMNLLQNALKYSPADASVELEVRQGADEALVAVIDHGAGIPVDELPRLFQRFSRLGRADAGPGGFLDSIALLIVDTWSRVWPERVAPAASWLRVPPPHHSAMRRSVLQPELARRDGRAAARWTRMSAGRLHSLVPRL